LRRALLLIAPALIIIAVLTAVPARATPPSGVTSVTIANGTLADIDVYAKTDIDRALKPNSGRPRSARREPRTSYLTEHGHTRRNIRLAQHPRPSLVIVVSGTATEYEGNDPTCTPHLHPARINIRRCRRSLGALGTNRKHCRQPRRNRRQAHSGSFGPDAADRQAKSRLWARAGIGALSEVIESPPRAKSNGLTG
jgi:hypothetical protein